MKAMAEHEGHILGRTAELLAGIQEAAGAPVAAIFKYGGYGDFMALACLAKAVSRHWQGKLHPVIVTTLTGGTPDIDLSAALTGWDGDVVRIPVVDMWLTLRMLRKLCPVVYHMPGYAVKRYTQENFDDEGQRASDEALKPLADFYFDFPEANNRLRIEQFRAMSLSSGLDVRIEDMPVSLRMPAIEPGKATMSMARENAWKSLERAAVRGSRYAVIHNHPGGGGRTKTMPPETMQAIVEVLGEHGLRAVQIGRKGEPKVTGKPRVIDRRGYRWPVQCWLISKAELYIGCEGGLAYPACALDVPALIGFCSTPAEVFRKPNEVPLVPEVRCDPCWWSTGDWWAKCPKGHEDCVNAPTPEEAKEAVHGAVTAITEAKRDVA